MTVAEVVIRVHRMGSGDWIFAIGLDMDMMGWSVEPLISLVVKKRVTVFFMSPVVKDGHLGGEETVSKSSCIKRELIIRKLPSLQIKLLECIML